LRLVTCILGNMDSALTITKHIVFLFLHAQHFTSSSSQHFLASLNCCDVLCICSW
jgi:hypothetical protein